MKRSRRSQRRRDITLELDELTLPHRCLCRFPEGGGDADSRGVPLQCPEVIPVRMHRLGRVAFVTDRRRQEPAECGLHGGRGSRRALGPTQTVEVLHGRTYMRPHARDERTVARIAKRLVPEENELPG